MTEEQLNKMLDVINSAEEYELTTRKKVMSLRVSSEFFKTLKELVTDRLDYSKHFPFDEKPCEDCVSRKVVLDIIKDVCFSKEQKWVDFRVSHGSNGQRDLIINYIESLPGVQLNTEWIPLTWDESKCNSSFPDDMDGCWAIFTDGKNISIERGKKDAIDHFFPSGRWFKMSDAIAWMPLPAKYKEGEEG